MKIAIISTMDGGPWAGSEELWAAMAHEALDAGHELVISVPRWPEVPTKIRDLERKGALLQRRTYFKGPDFHSIINRLFSRLARHSLRWPRHRGASSFKKVFLTRPDVICVSQGGTYDFWHLPDLKHRLDTTRIPFVVVCQANDERSIAPSLCAESSDFFAPASRVGFVSQGNLDAAQRQLASALSNATVVQNPVNLRDLSQVPWPSTSEVRLASIARLHLWTKGHDVLFEALSSPVWRDRQWQLNLFGDGPDKEQIQKLAQFYGLGQRVNFCGHVADVRQIWAEHQVLVMPSRIEGTPLALVEAMLCGRPAVVTDVAGNPEWVREGENGWIAPAPTARPLDAALERAWQAREEWQLMGEKAHQTAAAKRDPSPGKSLLNHLLEAVAPRT